MADHRRNAKANDLRLIAGLPPRPATFEHWVKPVPVYWSRLTFQNHQSSICYLQAGARDLLRRSLRVVVSVPLRGALNGCCAGASRHEMNSRSLFCDSADHAFEGETKIQRSVAAGFDGGELQAIPFAPSKSHAGSAGMLRPSAVACQEACDENWVARPPRRHRRLREAGVFFRNFLQSVLPNRSRSEASEMSKHFRQTFGTRGVPADG